MRHMLSPHNLARAPRYDLVPALRRDQQKSGTTSRTTHYSAIMTTLVSYTFTNYKPYLFTRAVARLRFYRQHSKKALVTPGQASSGLVR